MFNLYLDLSILSSEHYSGMHLTLRTKDKKYIKEVENFLINFKESLSFNTIFFWDKDKNDFMKIYPEFKTKSFPLVLNSIKCRVEASSSEIGKSLMYNEDYDKRADLPVAFVVGELTTESLFRNEMAYIVTPNGKTYSTIRVIFRGDRVYTS